MTKVTKELINVTNCTRISRYTILLYKLRKSLLRRIERSEFSKCFEELKDEWHFENRSRARPYLLITASA